MHYIFIAVDLILQLQNYFCKKTKSNILLSPNPLLVDEKKKNKTEEIIL